MQRFTEIKVWQDLLILSRDLGYIADTIAAPLLGEMAEVASMLHGLRTKVENDG